MTTNVTVTAEELSYVDPAARSDKFYRVFQFGTTVAIQYGKTGTFGTFKRSEHPTEDAAVKAAGKQADSKFKKGYERIKVTTLTFDGAPTDSDLDSTMASVPAGAATGDVGERQAQAHAAAIVKLNDIGTITVDPDVLARARKALEATSLTAGAPDTSQAPVPVRPMLADTVDPDRVEGLAGDDAWCAQLKLDGERFVIEVAGGQVAVYNRQGQPKTSNVAEAIVGPFRHLDEGRWVFDGEVVGRKLWLFDMVAAPGYVDESTPFTSRYEALVAVVDALDADSDVIGLVETVTNTTTKNDLLDTVAAESREGVIFRRADAPYQPGRRASTMLKHKLVKTADCVVVATGDGGKDNATVAVHDADGAAVVVGSVSTIGKGAISVGDVVEVRFLYVVDPQNPRMYQPRIVRTRTDKAAAECSITQFANAGTNKEL